MNPDPEADAFVTKPSSEGSSLVYSTYLGGSIGLLFGYDEGADICVDNTGCAYVTGKTSCLDFPIVNPYQNTFQGDWVDAFVTKLSAAGNELIYSTYLGGSVTESGNGITVDELGCAYVTGSTSSPNFPVINGYQGNFNGGDAFITKLSTTGNSLVYSTFLGGDSGDAGHDICIDASGCVYVTGGTDSENFPTMDAYQGFQGVKDVFVTKFSSTGNSLFYSTYLGGSDFDYPGGMALDDSGYIQVFWVCWTVWRLI